MKEFINPLTNTSMINNDDLSTDQGVNIIDFETVCYDKTDFERGRSLSLNFYKYQKSLQPCNSLNSAVVVHQFGEVQNEASQTSASNKNLEKNSKLYKEEKELANGRLCKTFGCICLPILLIILLFCVHIVLDEKIKGIVFSIFSYNI